MADNPGAGWHQDPTGKYQVRYHDGTNWTSNVSTNGKQATDIMPGSLPPAPAMAAPSPPRKKGGKARWIIGGIVVLLIIGAAAGGTSDKKDDSASSGSSTSSSGAADEPATKEKKEKDGCGTKASSDCTPHLGSEETVRVDALEWKVRSSSLKDTIGDDQFGTATKANGKFLVVKLAVHSDKNESTTLTDDLIKLEVDGNTYDSDLDGTVATTMTSGSGSGDEPFFLNTIGPDSDRKGTIVFDVPKSVLSKKIEVRFNELGFGDGHGYIRLPTPSGS